MKEVFYSPAQNVYLSKFSFNGRIVETTSDAAMAADVTELEAQYEAGKKFNQNCPRLLAWGIHRECQSRNQSSKEWIHGCPTDWVRTQV